MLVFSKVPVFCVTLYKSSGDFDSLLDFQVVGIKVTVHTVSLAGPRRGHRSKVQSSAVQYLGLQPSTTTRRPVSTTSSVTPAPGCRCLPPVCRKHISKILSVLTRRLRLRRYTRLGSGGGPVSAKSPQHMYSAHL